MFELIEVEYVIFGISEIPLLSTKNKNQPGDGNTIYMLRRFMIDIRFQGQGYGTKALECVKEEMKKYYNCNVIYLSVVPENAKAIHLYEKAGFVSTGIEIGDETHKEVIYKCQV